MIEKEAMFKIPYGLFMLTTTDGEKQNGCIVNTVAMLTDTPKRITIFVNNANYSAELLKKNGVCNVSVLTERTPFDVICRFGFSSGRDTDKFGDGAYPKTENGLYYLPDYANAVLSAKIVDHYDYGTHTLFVAEVTEARTLLNEPSLSYEYYLQTIKPSPKKDEPTAEKKKKWVCKICGYEYEGDTLPADYMCPLCKHPAEDFELVE